jgi:peroxin-5
MSQFLSGVDCGPGNALKTVSGRLERDYSPHQVSDEADFSSFGQLAIGFFCLLKSIPLTDPDAGSAFVDAERLWTFESCESVGFNRHAAISCQSVESSLIISNQTFKSSLRPVRSAQTQPRAAPSAFDLSNLRAQLSPPSQQAVPQSQSRGWADAFVPQSQPPVLVGKHRGQPFGLASPWHDEFRQHSNGARSETLNQAARNFSPQSESSLAPWQRGGTYTPIYQSPPIPQYLGPAYHPNQSLPATPAPQQPVAEVQQPEVRPSTAPPTQAKPLTESQEVLAAIAQSFVEDLSGADDMLAANPKLAGSKFMALIRGLGEREVVVEDGATQFSEDEVGEGAKFVQRGTGGGVNWAGDFLGGGVQGSKPSSEPTTSYSAGLTNGTTRQINGHIPPIYTQIGGEEQWAWDQQFQDQQALTMAEQRPPIELLKQRRKSVHFDEALGNGVPSNVEDALASRTAVPGAISAWSENDVNDFDEDAFMQFNGEMRQEQSPRIGVGAMEGWAQYQRDWEDFQRTEQGQMGLRGMGRGDQVERYPFQSGNPYSAGVVDAERFGRESPTFKVSSPASHGLTATNQARLKGVLELEAEVQHDPTNFGAWYSLGLKQQENEREDQAILALSKVVQMEPEYRPAYLALAVSYTNEGELEAANTMVERWIELADEQSAQKLGGVSWVEGQRRLVERLIDMARRNPEEVDAEVQVALGVLFNTSEVRLPPPLWLRG